MGVMALGRFIPIEYWPDPTRAAMARAHGALGAQAAARVRESMRAAPCTCASPGLAAGDGRCGRCWGWSA